MRALLALLTLTASSAQAAPLDREVDPVLVDGSKLAPFEGQLGDSLRVYAVQGERLAVIPFQFDERDGDDRYVVPRGREKTRDIDEGRVDANDELVFMAHDTGPQRRSEPWPEKAARVVEVVAEDPLEPARKGYAYIVSFEEGAGIPPIAEADYIDFDVDRDRVDARYYVLGNTPGTTLFDTLVLKGKRGRNRRDIFDRMKLRATISPKIGPDFEIDESRFLGGVLAYKVGAIRLIKRSQVRFKVVGSISVRTDVNDSLFYPSHYMLRKNVETPIDVSTFFSEVRMSVCADFTSGARGMTFYSESHPEGFEVDGVMSDAEKAAAESRKGNAWHALTKRTAAMVERTWWDPAHGMKREGIYLDDRAHVSKPERKRGTSPTFGFEVDVTHLESGSYGFKTWIFALGRRFEPGDQEKLFRLSDAPLKVATRRIQ